MSQMNRQQSILRLLEGHASMTVREISEALFYSESSVRRDVRELESRGLVTHQWGGVMLAPGAAGSFRSGCARTSTPKKRSASHARRRHWCGTATPSFWTPPPPCGGCSPT